MDNPANSLINSTAKHIEDKVKEAKGLIKAIKHDDTNFEKGQLNAYYDVLGRLGFSKVDEKRQVVDCPYHKDGFTNYPEPGWDIRISMTADHENSIPRPMLLVKSLTDPGIKLNFVIWYCPFCGAKLWNPAISKVNYNK